jgi:hypothetical protein
LLEIKGRQVGHNCIVVTPENEIIENNKYDLVVCEYDLLHIPMGGPPERLGALDGTRYEHIKQAS